MTILHLLLGRLVHSLALQPGMRVRHFSTSTARQEERGLHVIIDSRRRDTVTIFCLFFFGESHTTHQVSTMVFPGPSRRATHSRRGRSSQRKADFWPRRERPGNIIRKYLNFLLLKGLFLSHQFGAAPRCLPPRIALPLLLLPGTCSGRCGWAPGRTRSPAQP